MHLRQTRLNKSSDFSRWFNMIASTTVGIWNHFPKLLHFTSSKSSARNWQMLPKFNLLDSLHFYKRFSNYAARLSKWMYEY